MLFSGGEYFPIDSVLPEINYRMLQRDENEILLYYQNVRGLRTKIDDVFLTTRECCYDIIILTETGLDDRINSLQLFGCTFNVFRCDRSPDNSNKTAFGGVLVAVSQKHNSSVIKTVNGRCLEQVCVSVTVRGTRLLICGVYIPPDRSQLVSVIDEHIASISELYSKSRTDDSVVLICGDYNQPRIVWNNNDNHGSISAAGAALVDGIDFLNLCQINAQPNHLGRLLDLVFCASDRRCATDICLAPLVLPLDPHHPALTISLPVESSNNNNNAFTQRLQINETRVLNYRKIDFDALTEFLESVSWDTLSQQDDVDSMVLLFRDTICQWFSTNLPFVKAPASPPWTTAHLRSLKRERNCWQRKFRRYRTATARSNFKRSSDEYRRLNAGLYKNYVLRVQTDLRKNPRNFWNFVNSKRKCSSIPSNICLDGFESSSDSDTCEMFAQYFASVFADKTASDLEFEVACESVPANIVDLSTFSITTDMITAAAKKLKRSFSAGPDGIPAVVIGRCASILAEPLCCIFNKSFAEGKFPTIWKQSFMFPVFKTGDRRNVRNYRGITSLSAASKLFEIIVSKVVLSCTKSYISTDQHGFMPGRSVSTNLLDFTSTCITHMERKAQIDVIYTDLKAAFDRIDHRILLKKISRLGASQRFTDWLDSYLCGRVLRVQVGSCCSSEFTNNSGVPQGSNMGPLLFMLFFNDVASLLGAGCKLVYADDLKLYLIVRSFDDCRRLQGLLDIFVSWCRKNWLTVSIGKCQIMTFHRKVNPIEYNYQIDNQQLNRVDHVSDLGVLLDAKLTFNAHRANVITKATRQLGFISKVSRDFVDPHCLKALYCSLVRPILENACLVWCPQQLSWNLRIERVQKRFLRIALRNLPWRDPTNLPPYPDRCRLIELDTLERRRKIQQAIFVAKTLNGEIDSPKMLSLMNFRASQRTLRSTGLLQTNFHRTTFGFNEPIAGCIRTFSKVEELFDFNVPSHKFAQNISHSSLL